MFLSRGTPPRRREREREIEILRERERERSWGRMNVLTTFCWCQAYHIRAEPHRTPLANSREEKGKSGPGGGNGQQPVDLRSEAVFGCCHAVGRLSSALVKQDAPCTGVVII
jgi:hypothetical protein